MSYPWRWLLHEVTLFLVICAGMILVGYVLGGLNQ